MTQRVVFYLQDKEVIEKINEYRYKYGLSFGLAAKELLSDYVKKKK